MSGKRKIFIGVIVFIVLILVANFLYKKYQESKDKTDQPPKKKKTSFELGGASSNCNVLSEVEFNEKRDKIYTDVWWKNGYSTQDVDRINLEFYRAGDPNQEAGWLRYAYDQMLLNGYCTHSAG